MKIFRMHLRANKTGKDTQHAEITALSDTDLCEALRCCAADNNKYEGCNVCPCGELHAAGIDCAGKVSIEAAQRLDKLIAIRAERDAYKKQLQKLGMKI